MKELMRNFMEMTDEFLNEQLKNSISIYGLDNLDEVKKTVEYYDKCKDTIVKMAEIYEKDKEEINDKLDEILIKIK